MISETNMWIVRHKSGRYLASDVRAIAYGSMGYDFFYWLSDNPLEVSAVYSPKPWERMFATTETSENYHGWHFVADQFDIVHRPGCQCCGYTEGRLWLSDGFNLIRCEKHKDRNPCAIDGCARTRSADGRLGNDQWLCSEHWRSFCPPRSARRRAYHAFFRKAKKLGSWPPELEAQFWRFWDTLVASARARHAAGGTIDQDEINKMFGWDA